MSIAEAKSIPLDAFLEALGHRPVKTIRGELWYHCPFRPERTPSFKLAPNRLAWFDHGSGQGGNILDLALQCGQVSSLPQALSYLQQVLGSVFIPPTTPTPPPMARPPQPPAYVLHSVLPLGRQGAHATYLRARGIAPQAVAPYARELTFSHRDRPAARLEGLGLLNQAGGYEARLRRGAHYVKTCIGPKDLSFFPATGPQAGPAPLHVFEGAPDFYTYLTRELPPGGQQSYLILHGTAQTARALALLAGMPLGLVVLWCQFGAAGQGVEAQLVAYLGRRGVGVRSMKQLYAGYADLNAWHMR